MDATSQRAFHQARFNKDPPVSAPGEPPRHQLVSVSERRNRTMFRQTTTSAKPSLADPAGGQIVIVIARWLLVVSGLAIPLWRSPQSDLNAIRIGLFVLLALAVANFYLHMQILMKRPVIESLLYAASAADILVITL